MTLIRTALIENVDGGKRDNLLGFSVAFRNDIFA
jgi:hypothetical protein